jgi:hypothetical protein
MERNQMKASDIIKVAHTCFLARRPLHLHGGFGLGKSAVVQQLAEEMGGFWPIFANQFDPVDFRGVPTVVDMVTKWAPTEIFPFDPTAKGIIFLDELNRAPKAVQDVLFPLILEREFGDYVVPEGVHIVSAGNNASDGCYVGKLDPALNNRFVHVDYDFDLDDWSKWANGADVLPEVVAFARFRPELLTSPDKDQRSNCTPRTLEYASDLLKHTPGGMLEHQMLAGTIGEGAAVELTAFLKIFRTLPSPDAILLDPKGAEVPSEPAVMYALCGALARKASKDNFDRVVTYLARLPAEFSVMAVRDSINHNSEVQTTKAFIQWASDNSNVLI